MKLNVKRSGDGTWKSVPLRGGVKTLVVLVSCVALGGGTLSVWHFKNTQSLSSEMASVGASSSRENENSTVTSSSTAILLALGRHMIVPKENTAPSVAIIKDASMLAREQDFYRGAENGDALIVFPESHMAVIYGVRRDRIVTTGPIRLRNSEKEASASAPKSINADASSAPGGNP